MSPDVRSRRQRQWQIQDNHIQTKEMPTVVAEVLSVVDTSEWKANLSELGADSLYHQLQKGTEDESQLADWWLGQRQKKQKRAILD
jgi:hypothetical protein